MPPLVTQRADQQAVKLFERWIRQLKPARAFVQQWQVAELVPLLDQLSTGRSFTKGQLAYRDTGCVQCHRLMDPIGFSLENFDAIGLWRSHDEDQPIDAKDLFFDNTTVDGPNGLRNWLATTYRKQFVVVATEKLLTYALGRGVEAGDMPLVRAIARDALQNNGRFSAIVLGIVRSQPFQVNMRVDTVPGNTVALVPRSFGEGGRGTLEQTGVN